MIGCRTLRKTILVPDKRECLQLESFIRSRDN
jgi:hypothetical protein